MNRTFSSWLPLIVCDPSSYPCRTQETGSPQKDISLSKAPWGDITDRTATPYSRDARPRSGHLRAIQLTREWFDSCIRFLLFLRNSRCHVRKTYDLWPASHSDPLPQVRLFPLHGLSAPTSEPVILMIKHARRGWMLFGAINTWTWTMSVNAPFPSPGVMIKMSFRGMKLSFVATLMTTSNRWLGYSFPRWATADVKIKVPCSEKTQLSTSVFGAD